MGWFSPKSNNELGEYLPDSEAELQEGMETVEGRNETEAAQNCQEVASQYDAVESWVEETHQKDMWDCRFKFWG